MANSMNSSIMREMLVLQVRKLTPNEFNELEESWDTLAVVNGSYEPLRGQELWSSQNVPQRNAQVEVRIRIRMRRGLSPAENRVVYGGVVHDVLAVIHDRKHGQTQLMVRAVATEQPNGGTVNV